MRIAEADLQGLRKANRELLMFKVSETKRNLAVMAECQRLQQKLAVVEAENTSLLLRVKRAERQLKCRPQAGGAEGSPAVASGGQEEVRLLRLKLSNYKKKGQTLVDKINGYRAQRDDTIEKYKKEKQAWKIKTKKLTTEYKLLQRNYAAARAAATATAGAAVDAAPPTENVAPAPPATREAAATPTPAHVAAAASSSFTRSAGRSAGRSPAPAGGRTGPDVFSMIERRAAGMEGLLDATPGGAKGRPLATPQSSMTFSLKDFSTERRPALAELNNSSGSMAAGQPQGSQGKGRARHSAMRSSGQKGRDMMRGAMAGTLGAGEGAGQEQEGDNCKQM